MARFKVNRAIALKEFVDTLMANSPGASSFSRADVELVGKINPIGQTEFASVSVGYGSKTRVGRGQYAIPSDWLSGNAPWTGVDTSAVPAPPTEATKVPKTPKTKKEVTATVAEVDAVSEIVEVAAPVVKKNENPRKSLSKKELFEKAKTEIASRKKKATETAEAAN